MMVTQHSQAPVRRAHAARESRLGGLRRRAVAGAALAWLCAVGGVATIAWIAIQSAGYQVTGQPLVVRAGGELPAPRSQGDRSQAAPTTAATIGAGTASHSARSSATATTSGSSTSGSVSSTPSKPRTSPTSSPAQNPTRNTGPTNTPGQNSTTGPGSQTTQPTSGRHTRSSWPAPTSTTSTQEPVRLSASQWTPGGIVVLECTGPQITYWGIEPSNGWSGVQPQQKSDGSIQTGFVRGGQSLQVKLSCRSDGTPAIAVSSDHSGD